MLASCFRFGARWLVFTVALLAAPCAFAEFDPFQLVCPDADSELMRAASDGEMPLDELRVIRLTPAEVAFILSTQSEMKTATAHTLTPTQRAEADKFLAQSGSRRYAARAELLNVKAAKQVLRRRSEYLRYSKVRLDKDKRATPKRLHAYLLMGPGDWPEPGRPNLLEVRNEELPRMPATSNGGLLGLSFMPSASIEAAQSVDILGRTPKQRALDEAALDSEQESWAWRQVAWYAGEYAAQAKGLVGASGGAVVGGVLGMTGLWTPGLGVALGWLIGGQR